MKKKYSRCFYYLRDENGRKFWSDIVEKNCVIRGGLVTQFEEDDDYSI